jgi:hypothetical protein
MLGASRSIEMYVDCLTHGLREARRATGRGVSAAQNSQRHCRRRRRRRREKEEGAEEQQQEGRGWRS